MQWPENNPDLNLIEDLRLSSRRKCITFDGNFQEQKFPGQRNIQQLQLQHDRVHRRDIKSHSSIQET